MKNETIAKEAENIAYFMQRLYRKQLTTSLGGNISVKLKKDILITPSQVDKDRLTAEDIILMDEQGKIKKALHPASMESQMHLAVYKNRPDAKAIIHAHPFWASLLALSDLKPVNNISDEAFFMVKRLAFCEYQTMGTKELAIEAGKKSRNADVLILKNHGILTCGKNLTECMERMEVINNMAHYAYLASDKIKLISLSAEAMERINKLYKE